MNTIDILERLIAFDTVSRTPNRELIDFVQELFERRGIDTQIIPGESPQNVNLYASTGPRNKPGVMLSGHSDVVPVKGQTWSVDPFRLTAKDGRLYGRGTADMKGFVASAMRAMLSAHGRPLTRPLEFALSFDEEIGCVGVKHLLKMLEATPIAPAFCIVGEPTELVIATGHKGKTALRARCLGLEAHSALAPFGFNAIHLATDLVAVLRKHQARLIHEGAKDADYDVPYSTIHAGLIRGGVALNIVPNECTIDFEIRNIEADSTGDILSAIALDVAAIVEQAKRQCPQADIELTTITSYPGLNTNPEAEIVSLVKSLTGANQTCKVAFGTEAGLFNERIGIPTVVCGPGSMEQGHKPDEYVTVNQLERCDSMLERLVDSLCSVES